MPKPHWSDLPPLDAGRFERYFQIASEAGCTSISYDDLASWRDGDAALPSHPILFDFDHPNKSIRHEVFPLMQEYGFKGTLFVNTAATEKQGDRRYMTWDEIGDLVAGGWGIGAHMHHHVGLAYLARKDPSGGLIREEMDTCDAILEERLGIRPRDFAYTTTTWSEVAEVEVKRRYRSARLWTIGSHIDTDEGKVRFAELAGIEGEDESDGGPPLAARYITKDTHPYRLPAMDFEYLVYEYDAFTAYLNGADELERIERNEG
ncbi:MAG TPA: polysaccharide deacetylase family protein [Dehalococcoidia bacterium]|jgi:peptidoglycan/xylan/chitin deacetylase (PgdA/CDA1 family)